MIIRDALPKDEAALLALRNDPDAVSWSGRGPVTPEEHAVWFPDALQTQCIRVLVDDTDTPVGYARYAVQVAAQVSLSIADTERGKGYGRQLLQALEVAAREDGLSCLVASVVSNNYPSLRVFMKEGYEVDDMLTLRKRCL